MNNVIYPARFRTNEALDLMKELDRVMDALCALQERDPAALFPVQHMIEMERDCMNMLNADIVYQKAVHADLIGKIGKRIL